MARLSCLECSPFIKSSNTIFYVMHFLKEKVTKIVHKVNIYVDKAEILLYALNKYDKCNIMSSVTKRGGFIGIS